MQTAFTPTQLKDPGISVAAAILKDCVHYGFCTAVCPTWVLLRDENDGPRGRIDLIKAMLEAKSALLLAISHELRSPITRMRVNLELLEPGEAQQKLVDDLREMETLIASILESEKLNSRHAPLALEPCDMSSLVEEVTRDHPCRERISTRTVPVDVNVDPMRIKLLIKNLVDNAMAAIDACDDGAREVTVCTRMDRAVGIVHLEVADTGCGIRPEDRAHLFEPYFSTKRSGSGLGLAIVSRIISDHSGYIRVRENKPRGSRFLIELPSRT